MPMRYNEFEQPIGPSVGDWAPPPPPRRERLEGRFCHLEPLNPARHAGALHAAMASEPDARGWTYLPYGPFGSSAEYRRWMDTACKTDDPLFFAIVERAGGEPVGLASYLRIAPGAGSIEVGHIRYSDRLKRRPAATEAMYLMMRRAFELGYRRYEWKCDALNAPSRAAAQRLGFSFEGVFRQATVYKGRSRDTAWYAAIDAEWPRLREAFEQWLDPANFDGDGRQRARLGALTGPILVRRG